MKNILFLVLVSVANLAWAQQGSAVNIFCLQAVSGKTKKSKLPQFETQLRDNPTTPWTNHVPESSYDIQGFVKSRKVMGLKHEYEMYYRIDFPRHPNGEEWIVLNHGLGDHSGRMNALASRYLRDGYPVIRIDLLGHGRTLWRARQSDYNIEDPITMRAQAIATREVLVIAKNHGAQKIRLVGHSLGGGNLLAVAALLDTGRFKEPLLEIVGMNAIAFYAQDLGDWYSTQALVGRPLTESINNGMKFVTPEAISKTIDKQYEESNFVVNQFFNMAHAFLNYLGFGKISESITAPHLEKFMYKTYEPYFRHWAEKAGVDLNDPQVKEALDLQIRSAIAVTKGARSFNIFHPTEQLPDRRIPIQIVIGEKDDLVPMAMMKQAALRLEELGFQVEFVTIPEAGHLVTTTHPDQLYEKLRQAAVIQKAH